MLKLLVNIAITLFFVYSFIATGARVYWVNSGPGLAGEINVSETRDLGITCSQDPLIELKRLPDGSMQWHCGKLFPFYTSGTSKALAERFDGVFAGADKPRHDAPADSNAVRGLKLDKH